MVPRNGRGELVPALLRGDDAGKNRGDQNQRQAPDPLLISLGEDRLDRNPALQNGHDNTDGQQADLADVPGEAHAASTEALQQSLGNGK